MLPEYSVLMSVYGKDAPEHLDAAISSMTSQTVPFRDFVLVCDGSLTSALDAVIDVWQERLGERLAVRRLEENRGLGCALNEGLAYCGCDIVARMDADDVSRPDRCEKLLTKMVVEHLDLVGGAIEEFDQVPGDMGSVRVVPLMQADIEKRLKSRNPFNHMTVVFRKSTVVAVGGYEPFPWMEDYWLWIRMMAAGCSCANIADVVVDARVGNGMYARRSGWEYFKSQARFFFGARRLGFVGCRECAQAVIVRAVASFLPERALKLFYGRLLRRKTGER